MHFSPEYGLKNTIKLWKVHNLGKYIKWSKVAIQKIRLSGMRMAIFRTQFVSGFQVAIFHPISGLDFEW
jgi:hypothetical protein